MKLRERYKLNKSAKVEDSIICPSCGTEFIKTQHQQAFCKSKSGTICKDKYWNAVSTEKRCNTTRISPANQRREDKQEQCRYSEYGSLTYDGAEYDDFFDMNV